MKRIFFSLVVFLIGFFNSYSQGRYFHLAPKETRMVLGISSSQNPNLELPYTEIVLVPAQEPVLLNIGKRVFRIQPTPMATLKPEPMITTVPPCLVDCPPPLLSFRSCRGSIIFIDGVKLRNQKPKEKTYRGLSVCLEGLSADYGISNPIQIDVRERPVLTSRAHHL